MSDWRRRQRRRADAEGRPVDDGELPSTNGDDAPLWRRLHPDYRPHEHHHPADDPWDDQAKIDGIIAQTHADLNGHPVEQIEHVLLTRFTDTNLHLHVTSEVIRTVAEDIAAGGATSWSSRTLEGAVEREQARVDRRAVAAEHPHGGDGTRDPRERSQVDRNIRGDA